MPRIYYQHEMEFATFRPHHHHHFHQPSSSSPSTSSVLQRFADQQQHLLTAVHLQQYFRYSSSSSEPLELTASPLDLSLKTQAPITPPCTPSPGIKRARSPTPDVPSKKKPSLSVHASLAGVNKKSKATRKLNFDEDNSSPVSGTIIRELRPDENLVVRKGDIDPAFNVVEITDEAKAELAKIENLIGEYVCRLCKELYEDAFGLAQHRCSRIVHVEYRCPECDKVFNCPANLASHRRWHKPRPNNNNNNNNNKEKNQQQQSEESGSVHSEDGNTVAEQFPCGECGKKFKRVAYLRKHQSVHQAD